MAERASLDGRRKRDASKEAEELIRKHYANGGKRLAGAESAKLRQAYIQQTALKARSRDGQNEWLKRRVEIQAHRSALHDKHRAVWVPLVPETVAAAQATWEISRLLARAPIEWLGQMYVISPRQVTALTMRRDGKTFHEIASTLERSYARARQITTAGEQMVNKVRAKSQAIAAEPSPVLTYCNTPMVTRITGRVVF